MNLKKMRLSAATQMFRPDSEQAGHLDFFSRELLELRDFPRRRASDVHVLDLARHHGSLRSLYERLRFNVKVEITILLGFDNVCQNPSRANQRESAASRTNNIL